jgi:hypothetical protein
MQARGLNQFRCVPGLSWCCYCCSWLFGPSSAVCRTARALGASYALLVMELCWLCACFVMPCVTCVGVLMFGVL